MVKNKDTPKPRDHTILYVSVVLNVLKDKIMKVLKGLRIFEGIEGFKDF